MAVAGAGQRRTNIKRKRRIHASETGNVNRATAKEAALNPHFIVQDGLLMQRKKQSYSIVKEQTANMTNGRSAVT